jgi:hypothetical protein
MKYQSKRDRRILVAIVLLLIFGISLYIQAWIWGLYVGAMITQDWTSVFDKFPSARPPPLEALEDIYTIDDRTPQPPFLAGWIALASFFSALGILIYIWLKPKPVDP